MECSLNIMTNTFIEKDLKELLKNEIERNMDKFISLNSSDIYESAIQLGFNHRIGIDNKEVLNRVMNGVSEIYMNSSLD